MNANNLLRGADEVELLINPAIDSAPLLNTDNKNHLVIMESLVEKCVEVVDVVSQLQKPNLKEIATCTSTAQQKDAMTETSLPRKKTVSQDIGKVSYY